MKYFAAVLAFAAAVSAQGIADLPACSLQCLLTAVAATGCSTTDFKCSCGKADQLTASVTPCVQQGCSAADQAKVITTLQGICSAAGVPITIPTPGGSSSAAPASSKPASSPAASSPAASSPAVSSPAQSHASSAAPTAASYTDKVITDKSSAFPSATPTVGTTVRPSGGSSNGTVSTAAPSQYTGAAVANGVPVAAAGLFAALAYVL